MDARTNTGTNTGRTTSNDADAKVKHVLKQQDGLISRVQALDAGLTRIDVTRRVRRGEWVVIHPGVYITHNGKPTWQERAWAAVLYAQPDAALTHDSALRAAEGPGRKERDREVIHVAVDRQRHLQPVAGVQWHRTVDLDERAQWGRRPPRMRYEEAVLDVAAASPRLTAVATLADACGSRRTTAVRLRDHLDRRARIEQRAWLRAVLSDVADGTCSVLEHGYLDLVERAHGLPVGDRQAVRTGPDGRAYEDVSYVRLGLKVELDGKLFHTSTSDRDKDMERDLDAAVVEAAVTLRLGFGQVYERPCSTAQKVALVMRRLGWTDHMIPCELCREAA